MRHILLWITIILASCCGDEVNYKVDIIYQNGERETMYMRKAACAVAPYIHDGCVSDGFRHLRCGVRSIQYSKTN